MSKAEAAAVWMPINDLTPWADNPRDNAAAIPEVAKSIKRFGFASPIIARPIEGGGYEIIAGHTRHQAALSLGLDRVPVRVMDLDPTDAKLLALADNKVGEIATWSDGLGDILRELEADGIDLDGLGFGDDELGELLAPLPIEPDGTEDEVPEVEEGEPDSKPGEVYELGPHRLACGDCTDPAVWDAVVGDEDPTCSVTDPPYGMSYHGTTFGKSGLSNDGEDEWRPVLTSAVRILLERCPTLLAAVCFGASRLPGYFDALRDMDFHRLLTIYKPNRMAKPWRGWIMTSEVVGLWSHGDPAWPEAKNHCHDVYTFDYSERPDRSIDHPTVKPISIIQDLVQKLSESGAIVVDPFGGSGTTLIACAMTGRVARLIELDPRYCDVIRRRWTAWAKKHGQDPGPGALE